MDDLGMEAGNLVRHKSDKSRMTGSRETPSGPLFYVIPRTRLRQRRQRSGVSHHWTRRCAWRKCPLSGRRMGDAPLWLSLSVRHVFHQPERQFYLRIVHRGYAQASHVSLSAPFLCCGLLRSVYDVFYLFSRVAAASPEWTCWTRLHLCYE